MYKFALLLLVAVFAVATAQYIGTPYYGSHVLNPGLGLYRSAYGAYGTYGTPYAYRGLGYGYYG